MNTLTKKDAIDLAALEGVIAGGMATFQAVGGALLEIRDRRLYRDKAPTFDLYCRQEWGFSGRRGHQLACSVKVVDKMGTSGSHLNERQARELGQADEATLSVVAAQVAQAAQEEEKPPSAATLRDRIQQRRDQVHAAETAAAQARPSLDRPERDRIKAIRGKLTGALRLIDASLDLADALEKAIKDALVVLDNCQALQLAA